MHLIVKKAANAADPHPQANRRQIEPLPQMPSIQMQVAIDTIAMTGDRRFQIRRVKNDGTSIVTEVLSQTEVLQLSPKIFEPDLSECRSSWRKGA